MTFDQPWRRFNLAGRRWRAQVLDPELAFSLEPELVDRFGGEVLMVLAAPGTLLGAVSDNIEHDDQPGIAAARRFAQLVARLVDGMPEDGAWVVRLFERALLGRLRCEARTIDDWADLRSLRLGPVERWRLLGVQLAITYGPLWTRSPYSPSSRCPPDYGVEAPPAPLAVQYASALAQQGYGSTTEILRTWTPERLIEIVEIAAYQAEVQHRAGERARADAKR